MSPPPKVSLELGAQWQTYSLSSPSRANLSDQHRSPAPPLGYGQKMESVLNPAVGLIESLSAGCENPKPCRSQLTVLEYGDYDGDPVTKVMLQPLTGRTHQLRVHCEAVGHPIVGDHTYSLGEDSAPYRMMLHAHLLHLPLEPLPLQAAPRPLHHAH
ncbi:RNA pseudouridylate synthase domain-containing protein 1-like [Oncorhynchus keta]|uniref:RNA pseudouridylate synthase domain-containing protein 1-like n=1 Tax=Oncorhynchus keta TaxID=8018 RepID=UPI00227C5122|nr:RNA pseudouridylate synthase domain-containing protein 1-like [Oncorhynchus keta]